LAISLTKQFPLHHFAWKVLGALQKHTGRPEEALTSMLKSLEICPKDAEIHNNLGVTLKELCRFDEALEIFNEAIVLSPNYAEAYNNLGATFHELGRLEKAEASYAKAIELNSNYTEAYYNMGKTLKSLERFEDAIHSYTQAIELNPNFAEAYNNISVALNEQSKFEEAINFVKRAILLKPDYAEAYNNLGISLKEQGKFEEAINALNQAILIKPNYFEAYWNLGNVFNDQSKLEKGIMAYKKALSIKPDYEIGRATLLFELAYICDWETIKENIKLIPKLGTKNQFISPFSLLALEDAPERHFLRSKIYSKGKYSQNILPLPNRSRKTTKRIRIGYFSADFREHPVAFLILRVLELHDRNKFEVFGYSLFSSSKSEIRQRLESSFDHFVDIEGMSDKEKVLRAKEDEIDIAIDLTGYTENNCNKIFAYRIAPIQINYLGFPGTMGAAYFDYIVADQYLIPPENQKNFTEKQIYLPNTYMPTDNTREISTKYISKKKFGLPEESFIFCCFNNHYKITTEEFDIWMNFLRKLDNSFLWLSKSNYVSEANLKKEAIKRDIDSSRLIFAERVPIKDHLARYKLADIFLDTFNFNAHTTASEALWGGLPVITKVGKGFPARVASSLLNAINLPELITNNKKEYEDLVLELANNPKKLSNLKEKLANNRLSQPLFNTEQYTKFLEDGYKQAYLNNLKGNIAKNIIVS
jgi:protein O-GlcNAc transferase